MDMDSVYDVLMLAVCLMLLVTAGAILCAAFARRGGEIGGWELAGAGRRLRAVARITVAEGLRMRIAMVFVVLLVTTLPLLCFTARGDGTIKGQVQMFLGYSTGLTAFYLALLTIFFSSRTLAAEISSHQIYGLVSRPIPRWQILVGKWLGITLLNFALVTFAMAVAYGGTRWIVYSFSRSLHDELVNRGGLTDAQAADCIDAIHRVRGPGAQGADSPVIPAMAGALGWSNEKVTELLLRLPEPVRVNLRRLDELRRQVLVGRASVKPDPPDIRHEIQSQYERLAREGRLPESPEWPPERIREQIRLQLIRAYTTILPLEERRWVLQGPPPGSTDEAILSVRYKVSTSLYTPAARLADGTTLPENSFLGRWILGDPQGPNYYIWPERPIAEVTRAFHEFELPARCIEPDGTIRIALQNIDPRETDVVVDFEDGLEVLYGVAGFEQNVAMTGLALMVPLMFLAAFGLMMSTFCTFPVAALVCLALYAISGSRAFIAESLALTPELAPLVQTPRERVRKQATELLFSAVSLGDLKPTSRIIEGRAIPWSALGREVGQVVGIRGGLAMVVGVMILRRRELAAIIV